MSEKSSTLSQPWLPPGYNWRTKEKADGPVRQKKQKHIIMLSLKKTHARNAIIFHASTVATPTLTGRKFNSRWESAMAENVLRWRPAENLASTHCRLPIVECHWIGDVLQLSITPGGRVKVIEVHRQRKLGCRVQVLYSRLGCYTIRY